MTTAERHVKGWERTVAEVKRQIAAYPVRFGYPTVLAGNLALAEYRLGQSREELRKAERLVAA